MSSSCVFVMFPVQEKLTTASDRFLMVALAVFIPGHFSHGGVIGHTHKFRWAEWSYFTCSSVIVLAKVMPFFFVADP